MSQNATFNQRPKSGILPKTPANKADSGLAIRVQFVQSVSQKIVQKKFQKNVDGPLVFWQICLTHGNNRTTTHKKMRTKTLLMSAAALLAAGIVSSQAQPVYSQNVVGYASVVTPSSGVNYLISVPFSIGVSNGANEIWPSGTLPDFSYILTWDPNTVSYTTFYADSSSPSGWDDGSFNPLAGAPVLPVGKGFFLSPSAANVTNVFAGTIAVNVGTSNQMVLPSSGVNYLVGCVVPYAGAVTNGNNSGGGPNLSAAGGLPDFSYMLIWNPGTVSYATYYSDSSSPSGWDDGSFNPLATPPSITVGQGFFLSPSAGPYTWTVGL